MLCYILSLGPSSTTALSNKISQTGCKQVQQLFFSDPSIQTLSNFLDQTPFPLF